jgi:hypothetical protein
MSTRDGPGLVARSTVDRRWRGPKALERGGMLTGARHPATLKHESSSVGAQQREGNTGNSARATPGLGQRRGDWATVGKWRRRESSAAAMLYGRNEANL